MKVAVVGLGLIGGSIGLAARGRANAYVRGYDPDPQALAKALSLGAIDEPADDLNRVVNGAEVVFVAAPVGALPETVPAVLAAAGAECIVSDVGSTKLALSELDLDRRFIGGHPLAGSESAGIEHANADLFDGATWYLTPQSDQAGALRSRLAALLVQLGARPLDIDPGTHDRLMASVSHLPHVFANLLVAQAARALDGQPHAVGPSFRDATRVAGANANIWTDIFRSNREALIDAIDEAATGLDEIRAILAADDVVALAAWHGNARAARAQLLDSDLATDS